MAVAKMIAVTLLLSLGLIFKDPVAPRVKRQVPLPPAPGSPVAPAPQTVPGPPAPGSPVAPAPQTVPGGREQAILMEKQLQRDSPRGTLGDHLVPGGPPSGTLRGDRVLGEPSAPVAGLVLVTEGQKGAPGPPQPGPGSVLATEGQQGAPGLSTAVPSSVRHYNGSDVRIDSCPRDQVRLPDGGCHQLLTQGPCNVTEYVLLDPDTRQGYCAPRLCAPDRIFVFSDQLCHDPRDTRLCTAGRQLYQTAFGTPVCQCPGGTYEGDLDLGGAVCLPILGPAPACPPGQVLWFRDFTLRQECLPDPCSGQNLRRRPAELPFVPSHPDGRCYQLGQEGGGVCGSGTLYALGLGSLRGACFTLEDAGYIILDNETLAAFQEFYGPSIPKVSPEASRGSSQLGLLEDQLTGGEELDPPAVERDETVPDQEARIRGQDPTSRTTCHPVLRGPLVRGDTILGEVRYGVVVPGSTMTGLGTQGQVPVGPVVRGPLTTARALYRPPTAGGTPEKPLGTGLPYRGSHSGHGARKTVIARVVSGELVAMVTLRGYTPYDLSPGSARDLEAAISTARRTHAGYQFSGFYDGVTALLSRTFLTTPIPPELPQEPLPKSITALNRDLASALSPQDPFTQDISSAQSPQDSTSQDMLSVEGPLSTVPGHVRSPGVPLSWNPNVVRSGDLRRVRRGMTLPHFLPGNLFDTRLVTCRSGARRDVNAKCRHTILPSSTPAQTDFSAGDKGLAGGVDDSRGVRAAAPVSPRPSCPEGQAFNLRRQCQVMSAALASIHNASLG